MIMKDFPLYCVVALIGIIPPVTAWVVGLDKGTVNRLAERHAAMEDVCAMHEEALRQSADVHLVEFIRGHSNFISDEDLKYGSEHLRKLAEEKF
jgi:hypothetical protein